MLCRHLPDCAVIRANLWNISKWRSSINAHGRDPQLPDIVGVIPAAKHAQNSPDLKPSNPLEIVSDKWRVKTNKGKFRSPPQRDSLGRSVPLLAREGRSLLQKQIDTKAGILLHMENRLHVPSPPQQIKTGENRNFVGRFPQF